MRENYGFFYEISAAIWVEYFVPGEQRCEPSRDSPLTRPHFAIFHTESVNYALSSRIVARMVPRPLILVSAPAEWRLPNGIERLKSKTSSFTIKPY